MLERTGDPLVAIRAVIPDYPGYGDEASRLMSDRQVRAWVGSCLASARERLAVSLPPELLANLDDIIFRCQFPDQRFVARIEHARMPAATIELLMEHDRALIADGQRACDVDAAGLPGLLQAVTDSFDRRTPVSA
jgi:hypothetical protein